MGPLFPVRQADCQPERLARHTQVPPARGNPRAGFYAQIPSVRRCRAAYMEKRKSAEEQGEVRRSVEMATSKKDASIASKLLRSRRTSKAVKSVAGSDLAQTRHKKRKMR